jgi:hypothetical protein
VCAVELWKRYIKQCQLIIDNRELIISCGLRLADHSLIAARQMNGLRRNNDAMKNRSQYRNGSKKIITNNIKHKKHILFNLTVILQHES